MRATAMATFVLSLILIGCSQKGRSLEAVLFDSPGVERMSPTRYWVLRVRNATPDQRHRHIRWLFHVVDKGDCYTKFVALKVLIGYFENPENLDELSQNRAEFLARESLQLSNRSDFVFVDQVKQSAGWWNKPLNVAAVLEVDSNAMKLCDTTLPSGWWIGATKIKLDGNTVVAMTRDEAEGYRSFQGNTSPFVAIADIIDEERLIGPHHWETEVEIIMPNGIVVPLREEWSFEIGGEYPHGTPSP